MKYIDITRIVKAFILLFTFHLSLFTLISCDYLDVVPPEQADLDDMMINDQTTLNNLYSCYGYIQRGDCDLPDYRAIDGGGSDETIRPQEWQGLGSMAQWNGITPSSINTDARYPWKVWYNAIGYCNQFLNLIETPKLDLDPQAKAQYIAEVKFLKAYYHFRLLQMFGPIPIINQQYASNVDKNDIPGRSHFDYCVQYIDNLLTEAEASLPIQYANASDYGRATTLACKAIRARLYVLAASPLWNGSFPSRTWKNTRWETPGYGYELVSHEYDRNKWVKAREACLDAIESAEAAGHHLFTYDESEIIRQNQNVDIPVIPGSSSTKFKKQVMMFRYLVTSRPDQGNKEIIWGIAPPASGIDDFRWAMGSLPHYILVNNNKVNVGGWGGVSPTLYTMEHFYTKMGLFPEEDPEFTEQADWFKSAELTNPDIINLNVGREPRFYAWLSFDGDQYATNLANRAPVYCEMRNNEHTGYDAEIWGTRNYCVTGFLNKKWVHPNFNYTGSGWASNYGDVKAPSTLVRLADLYLYMAECAAQLDDTAEALDYLNRVRNRAGVQEMTPELLASIDRSLLQVILDERFIELYGESSRYYDIRRYLNGAKYQSSSSYQGLNSVQKSPTFENFNTVIRINQAFSWDDRMYLMPVPNDEVYANPQMVQAPGY